MTAAEGASDATWTSSDGEFVGRLAVTAGYDHRDDPSGKRGAHGATLWLVLRGPRATMACSISTGWLPRPLTGPYVPGARQQRRERPGVDARLADSYPSGGYLGIHASEPIKSWWQGPDPDCTWTGQPCYGDGGYLVADEVFSALVTGGHDAAFGHMREVYDAWLSDADAEGDERSDG